MTDRSTPRGAPTSLGLPLVVLASAALILPAPVRAGPVISAQSVTTKAGSTGNSLDVSLTNTGPSSVTIAGFSFEVMAATSAINFTSATTGTTTAPYIFAGNSLFGPNITISTIGQKLDASDLFLVMGSGVTLGAGITVGLGHLLFNVSPSASGPITVTLTPFPTTSLSDPLGNNIAITSLANGTITVSPSGSVPEPSSWVMALTGGAAVLYAYLRRHRADSARP